MVRTLTEQIYKAVREQIINLRIKPGEKLSESKLATEYNVSRGPIRNVIQKLAQDELVIIRPQIGTVVVPISLQKAKDILQVRVLLETYAAKEAAKKADLTDLQMLEGKLYELKNLPADSDEKKEALFATDNLLHQTIWRLCGNKEVAHIITNYKDEIQRIRLSTLELANRLTPSEQEMEDIFQAIKNKNPQAARKAMQIHIENIMNAIDHALQENKSKGFPGVGGQDNEA